MSLSRNRPGHSLFSAAFDVYFIVDGMWERLVPAEWRTVLQTASPSTLAGMALGRVPLGWPASLHAFVHEAQAAQLDPVPCPSQAHLSARQQDDTGDRQQALSPKKKGGRHHHWRGATPKKREEMERMCERIIAAASEAGTSTVVDVGSGKGYLSSLLGLEHGLQVLAIDSDAGNSAAAAERLRHITGVNKEKDTTAKGLAPIFVTARVQFGAPPLPPPPVSVADDDDDDDDDAINSDGCGRNGVEAAATSVSAISVAAAAAAAKDERSRTMRQVYGKGHNGARGGGSTEPQPVPEPGPNPDISSEAVHENVAEGSGQTVAALLDSAGLTDTDAVLVGLHACGDLTADSCRLFTAKMATKTKSAAASERQQRLQAMVLCGCCYGRITEPANFPLSRVGMQLGLRFGYVLRDLATHQVHSLIADPEKWSARIQYKHAYRAALEAWLREVYVPQRLPLPDGDSNRAGLHGTTLAEVAAANHGGRGQRGGQPSTQVHSYSSPLSNVKLGSPAAISDGKCSVWGWPPPTLVQFATVKKNDVEKPSFAEWATETLRHAALADDERGVALTQAGQEVSSPSFDALQQFYAQFSSTLPQQLLVLEALAAVMWPVAEGILVVDRLAFLQEHEGCEKGDVCSASVEALFPPRTSPRNWVLVAHRHGTEATSGQREQQSVAEA